MELRYQTLLKETIKLAKQGKRESLIMSNLMVIESLELKLNIMLGRRVALRYKNLFKSFL